MNQAKTPTAVPNSALPTGAVTFLFTDIEGSTRLWETHPEAMRVALARHDALIRSVIVDANGYVFKTVGDAFCAAFATATDAVFAALSAQRALDAEPWPEQTRIKVRMALHTGAAESRDGDYFGPSVNRVARLLSTGYGGQILLSQATYELCRDALPEATSMRDLGAHRLKDLGRPEQVYELQGPGRRSDFPPIRSLSTHPNNLPRQLTTFIGREKEISELEALLVKNRLLTLTGSGGSGKTRLGLQVAAESLAQFPDGAWFVELAQVAKPDLVAQTVATVLGVMEEPGKPILLTLTRHLESKRLLLVLDNCEHLLDACANLADVLMRQCPDVRILASSREALGIAGEQTFRVPSLSLPDRKQKQTVEMLATYESVQLFIDRARLVRADFEVTHRNAPALASICCQLDGIPLAIELAAARVLTLSIEEIDHKLDQRFRLLTGGSRTALPRHQTLRALIDWSYELLNASERRLLQRLSAFAGGWTLEAAEQISAGNTVAAGDVLDLLTSLSNKNLIGSDQTDGRSRYRLLETVRQYAREKLLDSGDAEHVRQRHHDYYLALAEDAESKLTGAEQAQWLQRLEEEHDNFRSALEWSLVAAGSEGGLRLCGALQTVLGDARTSFGRPRLVCAAPEKGG
jgi:predicted ATPase/class 3 adenylate cyclase